VQDFSPLFLYSLTGHNSSVTFTISWQSNEETMTLDLLAIAAHPDDVELTCGGTLLKSRAQGYQTGILDLTAGEMGTRGTPAQRAKEAAHAAKILKVSWRGTLGVPDSDVQASRQYKLAVARIIRTLRPRTVIIPYWDARHPDHYNASTLAYEGCFLAGLKALPLEGEPFRPFKILYCTLFADVRPTFVVDITPHFKQRRNAILAYSSQFRPKGAAKRSKVFIPLDTLEDDMNLLARHFGNLIGVKYGEPFLQKELVQIDDVVDLPVRSF
jgi:bacillithiol biosynthesis deacetylase BshB1